MQKKYNVAIYGAGYEYNKIAHIINAHRDIINVVAIITTDEPQYNIVDGIKCCSVKNLDRDICIDYYIIAIKDFRNPVMVLRKQGITDDKIILSKALLFPCFDFKRYLNVKNSRVSILANYCMGGIIYDELGMEMLSPTILMSSPGPSFLKILENPKEYLKREMVPYIDNNGIQEDLYGRYSHGLEMFTPKGFIKDTDIVWYFNHSADVLETVKKWNIRRERVNFDNLAVIMTIFTDEEAYRFEKLNISKKIGFYYKDLGLKSVLYLPGWESEVTRSEYGFNWPMFVNRKVTGHWDGVEVVDWLRFLNGEDDYIRFRSDVINRE